MTKTIKQILLVLVMTAGVLILIGCNDSDKGPMESAGEKLDVAGQKIGETAEAGVDATGKAAKSTGSAIKGAAVKTRDAVGGAVEKTGEVIKGDKKPADANTK